MDGVGFLCTLKRIFPILCLIPRRLIFPFSLVPFLGAITSSAVRKDGSPTGVVPRGGAHKTCSVKV